MHIVKWAGLLSVFWLLLSGYIQPLMLSFGVFSVVIVLVVLKRMDEVDQEAKAISLRYKNMRYLVWLIGEIFKSSVHVTKLIWSSSDQLSPSLSKIQTRNVPSKSHVLYANSITLTPGTLSVDLEDDGVTVHALQKASLEELEQGDMERKISAIWDESK